MKTVSSIKIAETAVLMALALNLSSSAIPTRIHLMSLECLLHL